jgi:hypothetical protein
MANSLDELCGCSPTPLALHPRVGFEAGKQVAECRQAGMLVDG